MVQENFVAVAAAVVAAGVVGVVVSFCANAEKLKAKRPKVKDAILKTVIKNPP
jgi:cell division protein FtsN